MANYFCTDSVEEQVDYLTDKVKDLKNSKLDKAAIVQEVGTGTDVVMSQKAVTDTINQNLQTINTEINGKLTKPTNPSAESAVTMLADGTVGTKPLSEIGGGGDLNLENGTVDVLIQTTDANHSFKVMTDGRAKVQSAPVENDDVLRLNEFSVLTQSQVDLLF